MKGFSNLADIEAFEQTPFSELDLPLHTYEIFQRGAKNAPDQDALIFFLDGRNYQNTVTISYLELSAHITRTANLFHMLGIGKDDVVSMLLPNLPEAYFTIFGGEAAGIINPINPLLEPATIADIMNAAGTKVLVTLAPFEPLPLWDKVDAIRHQVPTLEAIVRVDPAYHMGREHDPEAIHDEHRIIDFHANTRIHQANELLSQREIQPDDIASYFHTGGTTGTPKIAQHTHANEVADAWMGAKTILADKGQVWFCGLPLFHVNGVIVTGLIPWMVGATVVLGTPGGYRSEGVLPNFWKIVEHYKVSFFSGVPTIYSTLLQVPIGDADVSSLQFAICGAAPMPVEVFNEFQKRTGLKILEGYGLTEGTCVSSVNPIDGEKRVGSVGLRLPYQDMKTVIVDENGQYVRDCETDEIGLIIVKGPNVFAGYKEALHNKGVWIDGGDGEKWLNTGDMGRRDAEGYFWLTGRRKELIIRGGHNIDPQLIEGPLHQHPAVALAAAVGRPDTHAGELPVVYVQLKEGANTTSDELLEFARQNIGERAAHPKAVHIIDKIPVTAVGKIFKPELVSQEIVREFTESLQAIDDVELVKVDVRQDKVHGRMAHIEVTPNPYGDPLIIDAKARQILGNYTIPFELMVVE